MLNPRFAASGTGNLPNSMMDGELKKTSVRANRLEKKRFQMMMSAYDSAKKDVANEIKKSQVDVKRRLQKYKDRQREILLTQSEPEPSNADDHLLQQIRRLSQPRSVPPRFRHALPPFHSLAHQDLEDSAGTSDHGAADSSTTITTTTTVTSGRTLGSVTLPAPPDDDDNDEDDNAIHIPNLSSYHHHHQQKSKADLRPYIAWTAAQNSSSPDSFSSSSSNIHSRSQTTTVSSGQLLQLRGGRLGTPSRQVRYLDEEEIQQRCSFHRLLLDRYRHLENQRLVEINDLVGVFCGKSAPTTTTSSSSSSSTRGGRLAAVSCSPVMFEEGARVVSLPAGIPPSVHRAMRVKRFSLEQWVKVNRK